MTNSDETEVQLQEEIRWYQENSARLARENVPESASWKHAPGTTTISVRMKQTDVDQLAALAESQGVPVSHLVRAWIIDQLNQSEHDGLADALHDFEASYAKLRRAITAQG